MKYYYDKSSSEKLAVVYMKAFLILCLLIFISRAVRSQELKLTTYVESTHVSPKIGTSFSYESKYHLEIGAFYQEHADFMSGGEEVRNMPPFYERTFYGLLLACPLVQTLNEDFFLKFNVRTGVTNGENFTITPSVSSSLKLFDIFTIGAGVGVRAFRPTYIGSVGIRI